MYVLTVGGQAKLQRSAQSYGITYPSIFKECTSISTFKKMLKSHLFMS